MWTGVSSLRVVSSHIITLVSRVERLATPAVIEFFKRDLGRKNTTIVPTGHLRRIPVIDVFDPRHVRQRALNYSRHFHQFFGSVGNALATGFLHLLGGEHVLNLLRCFAPS